MHVTRRIVNSERINLLRHRTQQGISGAVQTNVTHIKRGNVLLPLLLIDPTLTMCAEHNNSQQCNRKVRVV